MKPISATSGWSLAFKKGLALWLMVLLNPVFAFAHRSFDIPNDVSIAMGVLQGLVIVGVAAYIFVPRARIPDGQYSPRERIAITCVGLVVMAANLFVLIEH